MAQQVLNDWSPWMRALSTISDDPQQGEFNMVEDAQRRAQAIPPQPSVSAPPAHRIEDDRTAGTRGTTPQSPTTSAIRGSINEGQTTSLADRIQRPPNPLEARVAENQAKLRSLGTAEQPQTLGDTLLPGGGFWKGLGRLGINAVGGGVGQGRRNEAFKNTLAQRTALQQSTEQDTRQLSQQEEAEARLQEQEQMRQNLAEQANQTRTNIANQQIAGRQSVADTRIGSAEDIAQANRDARPITKVMGDKTYQYDPDAGNWFDIGPAPINQTRPPTEPGQYQPVPDPADPNRVIGWVNPKARNYTPATSIPGLGAGPGSSTGPGAGTGSIPSKVTGQSKSRADAGRAIIPLIDQVDQMLKDPEVLSGVGPLPGRISDVERYIGNAPPKIARLYGTLKSIYSLGGTLHGWRALQVAQEFEKAYGGLKTNPDSLIAALEAMRDTAKSVMGAGGYGNTPPASGQRVTLDQFLKEPK